jgi:hypothetical protein
MSLHRDRRDYLHENPGSTQTDDWCVSLLPIGAKTLRDIDRYTRARRLRARGRRAWLWLGEKGRLTSSGIYQILKD